MATQPPRKARITVSDVGDIAVVQFVDKKILDEQNIQMIGDDLFRLVDELGRRKVLLNFGNVEFMSSAALGKLITLHRKLQAVQGKLVLCKIAKDILDVFKITKLDKILSITTDERFDVEIADEGPGFNPDELPDPTLPENLERGCGRGVFLIREFMTSVEYRGRGNVVAMSKVRNGTD